MEKQLEQIVSSIEADQSDARRRLYSSPHLLEYGSVAKLTQNGGTSGSEGASGKAKFGKANPGNAPAKMR